MYSLIHVVRNVLQYYSTIDLHTILTIMRIYASTTTKVKHQSFDSSSNSKRMNEILRPRKVIEAYSENGRVELMLESTKMSSYSKMRAKDLMNVWYD